MTTTGLPLRDALEDYLMLRRALGFKLASAARLLGQFISYLEARGTSTVTTSDALAWATLPAGASPAWQAIRLSAVRGFAAHLHGIDPSAQVPPAGADPPRERPRDALPVFRCRDQRAHRRSCRSAPAVAGRHLPDPDQPARGQRPQDRRGDRP